MSPSTTPCPLELSTAPPFGLNPLGKLIVPVTELGLPVSGSDPLIGYCTKSPLNVPLLTNNRYRSVAVLLPLSVMRPSTATE